MTEYVIRIGLRVDRALADFVEQEALPGTSVGAEQFWGGLAALVREFGPRNRELLVVREQMQQAINEWHRGRAEQPHDPAAYRAMLESIGYIVPPGDRFQIGTENVDPEIAAIAGPQLVVPSTNARYALNAANARWGSLYDAVYGTDAMGDLPPDGPYDSARGERVVRWVKSFLDDVLPLANGSWSDVIELRVENGGLSAVLTTGTTGLHDPDRFAGQRGDARCPDAVMLRNHGLGVEVVIDRTSAVGSSDPAGIADVQLESAVTAIIDLEDSVAAVDGIDKAHAYHNWLGLMKGDLAESVTKGDRTFVRRLNPDRNIVDGTGNDVRIRSRALLLVRNVGHLMTTPVVLDSDNNEVGEGILDALVSVTAALHDLARPAADRNSPAGSVYVVKPKMHGPAEVGFTNDLFTAVEQILGLPPDTVKIGIMDEERRTTLNLAESIRAARTRVAFINTGFLDRTGDEIHTSMVAGPMVRKSDMREQPWIKAYEDWNVDKGLACGLPGRAQIGKGMWAAPDQMADMLHQKVGHPQAGANCSWVPSPTAATLHAIHYHRVDVAERQRVIAADGPRATLDDLLAIPIAEGPTWSVEERHAELDNNAQGILGYVVRWIEQGIGCSKVPDIHGIALMEDRATCRISSQHIANWMLHGVVTRDEVIESFHRMAAMVDRQNADDSLYEPMAPAYDNLAFRAALDLVLQGTTQPSGYTEPILHHRRREQKATVDSLTERGTVRRSLVKPR